MPGAKSEEPGSVRSLDRLVTFVDAIVAIAITLLVLPLIDAAADADPARTSLSGLLSDHARVIYSFLLSFVVIFNLWRSHHDLFARLETGDRLLRAGTELWVLTIVITPFTTQLIATYGDDTLAEGLYIGVLLVSSGCLAAMSTHASRTPSLLREDRRGEPVRVAVPVAVTVLSAVALVLALAVPGADYSSLYVLLLTQPAIAVWRALARHRTRGRATSRR